MPTEDGLMRGFVAVVVVKSTSLSDAASLAQDEVRADISKRRGDFSRLNLKADGYEKLSFLTAFKKPGLKFIFWKDDS